MTMTLYKISFETTDKVYIGITTRHINKRLGDHKRPSSQSPISKAIRKHKGLSLTVLAECYEWECLCRMEVDAIKSHNSRLKGYNCTDGGEGTQGVIYSEEQRKANSERMKRYFLNPDKRRENAIKQTVAKSTEHARIYQSIRMGNYYKNNPEARNMASERTKEQFSSDNARNAQSERTKQYQNLEHVKKATSERAKKQWGDEENRRLKSEQMKAYFAANPDAHKKQWETRRKNKGLQVAA